MKSIKSKFLLVFLITLIGAWGCTQSQGDLRSAAAKIRHLEYRNAKLEEDYRAGVAENAALKKKLATAVKQFEDLNVQFKEMQTVLKERDELQTKLNASLGERDALKVQLTTFSKELQAFVGRVEQLAGNQKGGGLVTTVSQKKEE